MRCGRRCRSLSRGRRVSVDVLAVTGRTVRMGATGVLAVMVRTARTQLSLVLLARRVKTGVTGRTGSLVVRARTRLFLARLARLALLARASPVPPALLARTGTTAAASLT